MSVHLVNTLQNMGHHDSHGHTIFLAANSRPKISSLLFSLFFSFAQKVPQMYEALQGLHGTLPGNDGRQPGNVRRQF